MPEAPRTSARPEPLRRRARAAALRGLTRAPGPFVTGPLATGALRAAAGLARWSRYEQVTRDNLKHALGAEFDAVERGRIARGVRAHSARLMSEWLRMARVAGAKDASWIDELVECDASIERLEALASAGRGLLIATAHIGNWELLAAALRRRGLDGAVVGRRRRNDSSSTWLIDMRERHGIATLAQDEPARNVIAVLRRGATLGMLCDLDVRRIDGVSVPFLGRPARTMTAPAALARVTSLPILPVRCVARGPRYVLSTEAPLELRPELGREAAQLRLLEELNGVYGSWIREDPEQWAWHQPRWRSAP